MAREKYFKAADVVVDIRPIAKSSMDPNIPALFAGIMSTSKEDPLVKYRATFEGASISDVASIAQGQAFKQILEQEAAARNLIISEPFLVAQQEGGNGPAKYFTADTMLADGFPDSKPIHLHLLYAKGEDLPEEEGDNGMSGVTRKRNINLIEVADAIRFWFTGYQQIVINDITR